jgi:hypothetical protein
MKVHVLRPLPITPLTTLYHPVSASFVLAAMICIVLVAGHGVLLEREIQVYDTVSTDLHELVCIINSKL